MIKIIPVPVGPDYHEVRLDDLNTISLSGKIIVCESKKDKAHQHILVLNHTGTYSWKNFYHKHGDVRSRYCSIDLAIQSRYDKKFTVYVLDNKRELKEFINHR